MSDYKRQGDDITLIQMSNYVKPEVKELIGRKWVLNGDKNSFFQYVIDRRHGSPTNESVINVYCELLWGKGIAINGQNEVYEELSDLFPKREQQKCIDDFKTFGQYDMQVIRAVGGGVAKIMHLPTDKLGMDKMDDNGDINGVWYCDDWTNPTRYKPEFYPAFKGRMTEKIMVKSVRPYQSGKMYFSNPDYMSALQYAELEEEISNFSISHIKNGLSFGYIINFNNGSALTAEQKDRIERKIKDKLTGSTNAGKFILSFNDGKDAEVTVVPLEVNEAHSQWEFLSRESMQKILTAHGVTSPLLFGLPSATGFGSNADELDTASKLLQDYQIQPKQSMFIDELAPLLEIAGLETDLVFIPLRDSYKSTEEVDKEEPTDDTVDEDEDVTLSNHYIEQPRVEKGNPEGGQWTDGGVDYMSVKDKDFLNKKRNFGGTNNSWINNNKRGIMEQVMGRRVYDPTSEITVPQINDAISRIKTTIESRVEIGIDRDLDVLRHMLKDFQSLKKKKLEGKILRDSDFFNFEFKLSRHVNAEMLIELGEDISEGWEVVDERRCDEITLKEGDLNTVFEFARAPITSDKKSSQDTSLFKIRYKYAGAEDGEREFCNKVIKANKFYRAEDLNFKSVYNEDFAPEGDNGYNVFLYKGGVNCNHWWQRVIFLKKDNKKITVTDARKMILKLEPEDRKDARWERNEKEVAQAASKANNWWSLKPNYRDSGVTPTKLNVVDRLLKLAGFDPSQPRANDGKWTDSGVNNIKITDSSDFQKEDALSEWEYENTRIDLQEENGEIDFEDYEIAKSENLMRRLQDYFGGKYTDVNGVSLRISDHPQTNTLGFAHLSFVITNNIGQKNYKSGNYDISIPYHYNIKDAIDEIIREIRNKTLNN